MWWIVWRQCCWTASSHALQHVDVNQVATSMEPHQNLCVGDVIVSLVACHISMLSSGLTVRQDEGTVVVGRVCHQFCLHLLEVVLKVDVSLNCRAPFYVDKITFTNMSH